MWVPTSWGPQGYLWVKKPNKCSSTFSTFQILSVNEEGQKRCEGNTKQFGRPIRQEPYRGPSPPSQYKLLRPLGVGAVPGSALGASRKGPPLILTMVL